MVGQYQLSQVIEAPRLVQCVVNTCDDVGANDLLFIEGSGHIDNPTAGEVA